MPKPILTLGHGVAAESMTTPTISVNTVPVPISDTVTNSNIVQTKISAIAETEQGELYEQRVPIIFKPTKFIPSDRKYEKDIQVTEDKYQIATAEKIKPKWSPCPMKSADEPKYRSIQPILPKPKSPHAIT